MMGSDFPPGIRPYHASDAEKVAAVYHAAIHTLAAPFYTPAQLEAWAPAQIDLTKFNERMLEYTTCVAAIDDIIAAFISWRRDGYIFMLFTHPDFARRGLASALCERAEQAFRASNLGRTFTEASLAARPFFERRDFTIEREEVV